MSTANDKSAELAIFIQAVASYEAQIEKGRLALNLLQFYSPDIAFTILTEFCPGGVISQNDLSDFLKDWQVPVTSTEIRGIFLDFCSVRSVMDYQSFLLMTLPGAYLEKKAFRFTLESLTEETRFKLESSIVLFLLKELKFQRDIEQRRLRLVANERNSIIELYRLLDFNGRGYVKFEDVAAYLSSFNLEFESSAWANFVFRAKKHKSLNPQIEKITFTEFHDLLFPVTFFEMHIESSLPGCLKYLDLKEQGMTPDFVKPISISVEKENLFTPKKGINEAKKPDSQSQQETAAHTIKKSAKKEVSFFTPFYEIQAEDQEKVLMALSNQGSGWLNDTDQDLKLSVSHDHQSKNKEDCPIFSKESSPKRPSLNNSAIENKLDFEVDYSRCFTHKQLPSKFSRYLLTMKEASNALYD